MSRLSKFDVLKNNKRKIKTFFKNLSQKIFKIRNIADILDANLAKWGLLKTTTLNEFSSFLVQSNILHKHMITSPNIDTVRYIKDDPSPFDVALSLRNKDYISHYSAVFLHSLTDNIVKRIYVNQEQKPKPSNSKKLLQNNIDKAFSRPPRTTNQVATYSDYSIYLLNGKCTNNLGVIDLKTDDTSISVTDIERTLIDIAVRPNYSGGIYEVLNAYSYAKDNISIKKLVSYLKELNYTYPYHQIIGFYLERAGFSDKSLQLLQKLPINYNFYLTYQMKEKSFSEKWELFYPEGF